MKLTVTVGEAIPERRAGSRMRIRTIGLLAVAARRLRAAAHRRQGSQPGSRPPSPINLTVYVNDSRVSVSPTPRRRRSGHLHRHQPGQPAEALAISARHAAHARQHRPDQPPGHHPGRRSTSGPASTRSPPAATADRRPAVAAAVDPGGLDPHRARAAELQQRAAPALAAVDRRRAGIRRGPRAGAGAAEPPQTLQADLPRLRLRKQNLCAILACMQVRRQHRPPSEIRRAPGAGDLYALVVYLHKNCNADLFEAMGALELTMTQIKLLHQLERADARADAEGGRRALPLSLPAASRTVDDLVRRGMVERHEDVADRRMKRIRLTDARALGDPPAQRRPAQRPRAVHRDLDRRRASGARRSAVRAAPRAPTSPPADRKDI